jgi:pantothenate kinase
MHSDQASRIAESNKWPQALGYHVLLQIIAIKINIILHNLQGINDHVALRCISNYYSPLISKLDILCLQKHKLSKPRVADLSTRVWRQAHTLNCKAMVKN